LLPRCSPTRDLQHSALDIEPPPCQRPQHQPGAIALYLLPASLYGKTTPIWGQLLPHRLPQKVSQGASGSDAGAGIRPPSSLTCPDLHTVCAVFSKDIDQPPHGVTHDIMQPCPQCLDPPRAQGGQSGPRHLADDLARQMALVSSDVGVYTDRWNETARSLSGHADMCVETRYVVPPSGLAAQVPLTNIFAAGPDGYPAVARWTGMAPLLP
jgi:hypothetical protein